MTKSQLLLRIVELEALIADGLILTEMCHSINPNDKWPKSTESNWTETTRLMDVCHESEVKLIARAQRMLEKVKEL